MNDFELPFSLKICYAFFFIQGAIGMFLSILIWFYDDKTLTFRLLFFLFLVLYFILNIEIGKGLKKIKKWSFFVAIILCIAQTILVLIGYSTFSLFTIFSIVVMTLLITLKKYFWMLPNDNTEDKYVT